MRPVGGGLVAEFGIRGWNTTHGDRAEELAVIGMQDCRKRPRTDACAFSSIASNTGRRSPGEELITCNTSAVAVCCSRASRVR